MSNSPSGLEVRGVVRDDAARLTRFFERCESACFCRYHDFLGDARAFQWTMATCPEKNRDALCESLGELTRGLVALRGDEVVGWLRYGPPSQNKWMNQRLYSGLPCFAGPREGVLSVLCMLVLPELRRSGIAQALLLELIQEAGRERFSAIEALPRGAQDVRDEELWTGPLGLYLEAGFTVVHDFAPYPVVRLDLQAPLRGGEL